MLEIPSSSTVTGKEKTPDQQVLTDEQSAAIESAEIKIIEIDNDETRENYPVFLCMYIVKIR